MFNLQFPIDPKLAAAIERRRAREEERKSRILDEKKRRIGIDVAALTQQMEERQQRERLQSLREREIEREMLLQDQMAVRAHQRQMEQKRRLERAVDRYRITCQCPETQRDFDLNDPLALKKSRPPRDEVDDGSCGPSSLQKFDGEDTWKKERELKKQELQKIWLENQSQEKRRIERQSKNAEMMQDNEALRIAKVACEQMENEKRHRQSLEKAVQNYNQQLLQHKIAHTRLLKQRELEVNAEEMENHIFSNILSEDPAMAISAFGPHRVIPDRWKGMSSEQVGQILQSQREQALEKKVNEVVEKQEETAWEHQLMLQTRAELLRERQRHRLEREYHRQVMEDNKKLALEQKAAREHLNQNVYRGITSTDFFSQFGQSCR